MIRHWWYEYSDIILILNKYFRTYVCVCFYESMKNTHMRCLVPGTIKNEIAETFQCIHFVTLTSPCVIILRVCVCVCSTVFSKVCCYTFPLSCFLFFTVPRVQTICSSSSFFFVYMTDSFFFFLKRTIRYLFFSQRTLSEKKLMEINS